MAKARNGRGAQDSGTPCRTATRPLLVATASTFAVAVLLCAVAAGSAAPVQAREQDRQTTPGRLDPSSQERTSEEAKRVPWRAVPVVMTPTPYDRRPRRRLDLDNPAAPTTTSTAASKSPATTTTSSSTGQALANNTDIVLGGPFGVGGDWLQSISLPEGKDGSLSLRGAACMEPEKREEVREVFRRRRETPVGSKVAACVRTKDAGRFLPEWIAHHYAIGVDELTLYDDDSVDRTKEILQPFVDAGLVVYLFKEIGVRDHQMQPLNHCLKNHMKRRERGESGAPVWVLFHDVDEYIFPLQTNQTMSGALMKHPTTCCTQVARVQYGTSGIKQQPHGLMIELFLKHAQPGVFADNRYPKVAVNLDPTEPERGLIKPPLFNMHDAEGCKCEPIDYTDMRINHYLGSAEDYLEKTKRFWEENHSREKMEENLRTRDINVETSDTITAWACAARETLFRVVNGIDVGLGFDADPTEQRTL